MKKFLISLLFVFFAISTVCGRVAEVGQIVRLDQVDAISGRPAISGDGCFVVAQGTDGIVKIDLANKVQEKIADGHDIYNIVVSPDGESVAFIRPTIGDDRLRYTSVEVADIETKTVETVVGKSRSLGSGICFGRNSVKTIEGGRITKKSVKSIKDSDLDWPVVGIYLGHLMVDGTAIDPQGKGSYLWPSLSPDGKRIVYWLVGQGCFVCNIDGSEAKHLGGMRAAVWAGNDAVIGMYDRDDGVTITESRLVAKDLRSDSEQLLTPEGMIALFPAATPSRVAFVDLEGTLHYFDFKIGQLGQ